MGSCMSKLPRFSRQAAIWDDGEGTRELNRRGQDCQYLTSLLLEGGESPVRPVVGVGQPGAHLGVPHPMIGKSFHGTVGVLPGSGPGPTSTGNLSHSTIGPPAPWRHRSLGVCAPEDSARSNLQHVGVQLSNCYRIWYQDRRKPGQNRRSAAQAPRVPRRRCLLRMPLRISITGCLDARYGTGILSRTRALGPLDSSGVVNHASATGVEPSGDALELRTRTAEEGTRTAVSC